MWTFIKTRTKKIILILIAGLGLSVVFIPPVRAELGGLAELYLAYIMQYTYGTLNAVNNVPTYLNNIMILVSNWQQPDTTKTTADIQGLFTQTTAATVNNSIQQIKLQKRLINDYFGQDFSADTVPYANDMTYTTLLGYPYFETDPRKEQDKSIDPAYNYIKNVSGLNVKHVLPDDNWRGNAQDKLKYKTFFNTIGAVQTFNAYVLSESYIESLNGYQPYGLRYTLMEQASSPDWFTQVSSESIGVVMRQILMYLSQLYVVSIQMLQTQKQLVATMAMSNTLFIMGNQFTETQLLNKATGKTP